MQREIIIAGGGIAGFYAAKQFNELGISTVVIEPSLFEQELKPIVVSTPVVTVENAKKLGMQVPDLATVNHLRTFTRFPQNPVLSLLVRFAEKSINKDPMCAPLYQELVSSLNPNRDKQGNIERVTGRVSDLIIEQGRVKGVRVKDEEIRGGQVIDATGRSSILVKKLIEKQSGSVVEKRMQHTSRIIGGYFSIQDQILRKLHIEPSSIYLEQLPNGLLLIFVPTIPTDNSPITHLLLIEGNVEKIEKAYEQVKKDSEKSGRAQVMFSLMKGSRWQEIFAQGVDFHASVYFRHNETVFRGLNQSAPSGLALIGDAQGHENPVRGIGVGKLVGDVDRLVQEVGSGGSLEVGFKRYNEWQNELLAKRSQLASYTMAIMNLIQKF